MRTCTHVRDITAMRVVSKQFAHAYKSLSSSGFWYEIEKREEREREGKKKKKKEKKNTRRKKKIESRFKKRK